MSADLLESMEISEEKFLHLNLDDAISNPLVGRSGSPFLKCPDRVVTFICLELTKNK